MRPDRRQTILAPAPAAGDEDSTGWLVTFSDLVLQLFAFVLVAAVLGSARQAHPPAGATGTLASGGRVAAAPVARDDAADTSAAKRASEPLRAETPPPEASRREPSRSLPAREPAPTGGDEVRASGRSMPTREVLPTRNDDVASPPPPAALAEPAEPDPGSGAAESPTSDPSHAVASSAQSAGAVAVAPESPGAVAAEPAALEPLVLASQPPARSAELTALGRYLDAFVQARGLQAGASVAVESNALVLSLRDAIGFASGSAELRAEARPLLREMRDTVRAMPRLAIEVAGHTDDRPIRSAVFPSNLELSLARAARVAHELTQGDPDLTVRTFATGFGEHHPIVANADARGRAQNRRVEIRLVAGD